MPIPPKLNRIIRSYWRAFGSYTPQIILISVLSIVSSVFEGLGITAIIPIFSFVGGTTGAPTDTISKFIARLYHLLGIGYTFENLIIGIAVLFILRAALIFSIQFITGRIVYGYERDMRHTLFASMLASQWSYLSRQRMGNLEQLLTTNIMYSSQVFLNISTSILISVKTIMYLIIAINVSVWAAGMSLVVGGIIFLILRPLLYRTRTVAMRAETTNRALAHFAAEHVGGMKALKAMAVEDEVEKGADSFFDFVRTFNTEILFLRSIVGTVIQFSGVLFIGAVFFIMYRSPGFSIAAFAVIVYAINQIFSQVQAGQAQLHGFGSMTPYLLQVLTTRDESRRNIERVEGTQPFSIVKELLFRNISFAYPDRAPALTGVSFTAPKGEIIALIGPSGAGKTTIADLLLRLVDPSSGTICVDDRDVRDIGVREWRKHVGYVPQDSILLNDTIERNISFYDDAISSDDITRAAKAANIHTFIETLPEKYQTFIGDRGILISGGQRQRIAMARALARKPDLLILDEATSSLDSESENAIKESVEELRGTTTVIVIAHRLSSISGADRIVVLKAGSVVEEGAPADLLKRPDSYYTRMLQTGTTEL